MLVDLSDVGRGDTEKTEVPEKVVDDPQLAVRDEGLLGGAVPHREEHVLADRQHERLGGDPAERRGQVSPGVSGDVTALPLPRHAEQVVGIHHGEIGLQEAFQEGLLRLELQRPPELLLPELRGEAHHRPEVRMTGEPADHLRVGPVLAAVPAGVRPDLLTQGLNDQQLVRRTASGDPGVRPGSARRGSVGGRAGRASGGGSRVARRGR